MLPAASRIRIPVIVASPLALVGYPSPTPSMVYSSGPLPRLTLRFSTLIGLFAESATCTVNDSGTAFDPSSCTIADCDANNSVNGFAAYDTNGADTIAPMFARTVSGRAEAGAIHDDTCA